MTHCAFYIIALSMHPALRLGLTPDEATTGRGLLDELAVGEAAPQISHEVGLLLDVLVSEDRGDGPGRLLCVVEGNTTLWSGQLQLFDMARPGWADLREHVVDNVVLNDAVEDVAADETKVTVDGGHGALDEGPLVCLVVLGIFMRVVKVRDGNW